MWCLVGLLVLIAVVIAHSRRTDDRGRRRVLRNSLLLAGAGCVAFAAAMVSEELGLLYWSIILLFVGVPLSLFFMGAVYLPKAPGFPCNGHRRPSPG